ncbi:Tethering factor for nuclear proteasome sts1 [Coemansia spiralis]|uniref:Tethering factor for nuclear proteasome STS1 n=1 Tax=Coemansia spiralis TaxID=417178 RepID=A0A9W8GDS9_9FUNG|nr:Tethering factor for nuclear proteasome sts1 [Coemansia spiralis]
MSQQSHWKASALAATFSTNAGFNGTAWGAARPPHQMNNEIGFGMGFGSTSMLGNMHAADPSLSPLEPSARRQKRKASSEDESMDSSSPTPEPAVRKTRGLADPRRYGSGEGLLAASTSGSSPSARQIAHSSAALHASAKSSATAASQHGHRDGRKRTRMMDTAAPNEVSLDKLLEPLEEQSLRQLLDTLLAQNPLLAAQVRQLVPKPTVNSACSQLVRLERRLQAAFPYNKSGPATDDYTYHRVRPALEELRDTIVIYLDHFTHYGLASDCGAAYKSHAQEQPPNALSHPAEWFDLLTQATDVAMRMPKWDRSDNNEIRRETLRQLADGWLRAIMATSRWTEEGHIVGRGMLSQWAQQLDHFYANAGEPALLHPAVQAFQRSFGQHCARGSSMVPLETTT